MTWAVMKTRCAEYALSLTYHIGGKREVKRGKKVLGLLGILCTTACNPAAAADHPPLIFTDRLISKIAVQDFCMTSVLPGHGPVGLHLSDFQKHSADLPTRPGVSPDEPMEIVQKKLPKAHNLPPPCGASVKSLLTLRKSCIYM